MKKIIRIILTITLIALAASCSKKQESAPAAADQQEKAPTTIDRFIGVFLDNNLSEKDKETRLLSICAEIEKEENVTENIKSALHQCTQEAVDAIVAGNRGAVPRITSTSYALNNLVGELDSRGIIKSEELLEFVQTDTAPLLKEAAAKLTDLIEEAEKSGNKFLISDCLTRAEEIGIGAFSPDQLERIEKVAQRVKSSGQF